LKISENTFIGTLKESEICKKLQEIAFFSSGIVIMLRDVVTT